MLTPLFGSIQKFVLRTYRIKPFHKLYRAIYWLALTILVRQLRTLSPIEKVYLRRGMSTNAWIPGSSDIDLFILLSEIDSQKEIDFLKIFWQKYFSLKKWFPFLGEVQIATQTEFKNYTFWGDIRAWESGKTWQPVYSPKNNTQLAENSYQYSPLKFKLDALTEMLNAYLLFTNTYFGKRKAVSSINYYKTFADILKYGFYLLSGPQELPIQRNNFLIFYSKKSADPELKNLVAKINRGEHCSGIDFPLELYIYLLKYLDNVCGTFFPELNIGSNAIFLEETKDKSSAKQDEKKKDQVQRLFREISGQSEGNIQRIIFPLYSYLPSSIYVIINKIKRAKKTIKVLRYRTLTDLYGFIPLILTAEMLKCLTYSLHLETPFNYYSLGNEWTSFPEEELERPDDSILLLLLKECIANLSISFRMYERGLPAASNTYTVYYLLDRILRLHLAWEKKIIVPAPLSEFLKVYANYYPRAKEWLKKMEEIISLPAEEIERINIGEFYYANYPFFSKILGEINRKYV